MLAALSVCLAQEELSVQQQAPDAQNQQMQAPRNPRQMNVRHVRGDGTQNIIHQRFSAPLTARKIQTAIDDACLYLRKQQLPNGSFSAGYGAGESALAALALLAAGADPASDEGLGKTLNWLLACDEDNTYYRGLRANVWEYALRKVPAETRYKKALQADYEWLLKALGEKEGWRYSMNSTDWDNSVTQYGVLGIWAATRAGFDPGDKFWQTMSKHFLSCQTKDGGWHYTGGGETQPGGTPNMATAGLASLFLVLDMYHGRTCYSGDGVSVYANREAAACLEAIRRGMDWLSKNHQGGWADSYFLYGIERSGVASGRKYIGGVDWFKEGALSILSAQQLDGSISLNYGGVVGTSLCTLFLVYGGAPVAYNKLEYGADQDWNLNPRDLANLSKYLWSAYERPLNWSSVSISAPVSEFDAPILFVSGSRAAKFSDAEVAKLREYIQRGGTILAEPSARSAEFASSMEVLARQMFPATEYPDYQLQPLPLTHPLFAVLRQNWKSRPALRGISDGSRTFFLVSDGYLSGDWQMNRSQSDAFDFGLNLLFYATDLGTLEGRFASGLPDTAPAKLRKTALTVARIKPAELKSDPGWAAAPLCWKQCAPYLAHVGGTPLDEKPAVELGRSDLSGLRLLHLTGRSAFTFSETERQALKKFIAAGGTLLVDAYAGSTEFAAAARRELETTLGKLEALNPIDLLASGQFEGGSDLSRGLQLKLPARKYLRKKAPAQNMTSAMLPLEAIHVGKRAAVLFSEFDLSGAMAGIENYQACGFKPASARRIVGNLAALLSAE